MGKLERQFERFRKRGDPQALGTIFDETAAGLLRAAMHLSRDVHQAEDLVQQTFHEAIRLRDRFEASRKLVPWLHGLLGVCWKRARRAQARTPDPERLAALRDDAPELDAGLRPLVVARLGDVPKTYRAVLALRLLHEMTPAEIALALDLPAGTVRARLHRGLALLRARMPRDARDAAPLAVVPVLGLETLRGSIVQAGQAAVAVAPAALVATAAPHAFLLGAWTMKKTAWIVVCLCALGAVGSSWLLGDARAPSIPERAPQEGGSPPEPLAGAPTLASAAPAGTSTATTPAPSKPPDDAPWRIQGRVTADDAPLEGVRVTAVLRRAAVRDTLSTGRTDADGRYTLDLSKLGRLPAVVLRPATLTVTAEAPGHLPHRPRKLAHPVATRGVHEYDIEMTAGFRILGRAVDDEGVPLAGAFVWGQMMSDAGHHYAATSRADGSFVLGSPTTGARELFCWASRAGTGGPLAVDLRGAPRDIEVGDLVVTSPDRIEGHLEFADGTRAAGIELELGTKLPRYDSRGRPAGQWIPPVTTTDDEGRFSFAVPNGDPVEVKLRSALGGGESFTATPGTHARHVLEHAALRIRVRGPQGTPAPGATSRLQGWRSHERLARRLAGEPTYQEFGSVAILQTQVAEHRVLVPRGAGLLVTASLPQMHSTETVVRLRPEEVARTVDMVLGAPLPSARVRVRARDADEAPITSFMLRARSRGGSIVGTYRGGDGSVFRIPATAERFEMIPGLGPGVAAAFQPDGTWDLPVTTSAKLTADKEMELAFTSRRGGRVRVFVDGIAHAPRKALDGDVRLRREDGRAQRSFAMFRAERNGRVSYDSTFFPPGPRRIGGLFRPGALKLVYDFKGYRPGTAVAHVRAGETVDVTLRLERR